MRVTKQAAKGTNTLFRECPLKSSMCPKVDTCQWVQGACLDCAVVGASTWHLVKLQRRQRWARRWEGRFLLEGPLGGSLGGSFRRKGNLGTHPLEPRDTNCAAHTRIAYGGLAQAAAHGATRAKSPRMAIFPFKLPAPDV